ncbi:DUF6629 family protein [Mycobacterium paraseoulense]|uniref:Uncharacterized protein n=1 Tax=Mycobacterium paraseoulense TaxID=590652 RepID=A0A1X0I1W1_9MYCO|nr:DUF6629 family protein [Mycobacterium paraseoulense]MCV7393317.1 hypothetical protein [Mycobacterium paraseoulense]ORB32844.1 hypothetical protein BST39_28205 [Mycobacterium paraseoulense]BBZ69025.1 hypothetical protein MPRS_01180 [Mycobacterium paraseoulense]
MCFSITADLVVGTALVPVAVAALREVKQWRELPFALLPTVFAVHQFLEAAVWPNDVVSAGTAQFALRAYVFIALPLLPALVPFAILMLEPRGARLRVAPFVALGAVVSAYLAVVVLTRPIGVKTCPHALEYQTDARDSYVWAVLYIVAVIGPALISGYRSIVVFGLANLVGLIVVAILYLQAFASLWCIYAAVLSVLVLVHMRRRRRLPDSHRNRGVALDRATSSV